jgi:phosphatidate cytidylyltransferase
MLKQRIITAILLLLVLLPALFHREPWPFISLALIFMAAATWEWAKANGCSQRVSLMLGLVCCVVCILMWWAGWLRQATPRLWLFVGAGWVLGGAWVLRSGVSAWAKHSLIVRTVLGVTALTITWLAVGQAKVIGYNFLLSVLALVWAADIAAYFAGRAWGGRWSRSKLAASISPGKSWEGVWGGMVGVILLALVWRYMDIANAVKVPSLYTQIGDRSLLLLMISCVFLAAMSVVGDLIESLVKRSAGIKDSSGLLPGHGGVLDRIDALLPTLPLAMMLHSM